MPARTARRGARAHSGSVDDSHAATKSGLPSVPYIRMRGLPNASGIQPIHPNGSCPDLCNTTITDSTTEPAHSARGASTPATTSGSGSTTSRNAAGERSGAVTAERDTAAIQASHVQDGNASAFLGAARYSAPIARSNAAIAHSLGVENGRDAAGQQASGSAATPAAIVQRAADTNPASVLSVVTAVAAH